MRVLIACEESQAVTIELRRICFKVYHEGFDICYEGRSFVF